ncbi:hypothetical protein Cgig2_033543 [Carnegiea gigantea]|uniref:Uncharacterized protein n=1 Tax=Carnegiea gigantea TaxID=171969 RepID=A0A9Q1QB05_9CARY|nr:hypothetical protein Cgig2_033543 [Carnegiea gigantea]
MRHRHIGKHEQWRRKIEASKDRENRCSSHLSRKEAAGDEARERRSSVAIVHSGRLTVERHSGEWRAAWTTNRSKEQWKRKIEGERSVRGSVATHLSRKEAAGDEGTQANTNSGEGRSKPRRTERIGVLRTSAGKKLPATRCAGDEARERSWKKLGKKYLPLPAIVHSGRLTAERHSGEWRAAWTTNRSKEQWKRKIEGERSVRGSVATRLSRKEAAGDEGRERT